MSSFEMSNCIEQRRNESIKTQDHSQLSKLSRVFHELCHKNTSLLHPEDLKVAIIILFGYKPSKYELNELINGTQKRYGQQQIGMPLEHFIDVMSIKLKAIDSDDEIRQTFLAFDYQCRGFLTMDDFKKASSFIAPHLSLHTLETAFREVDRDGDGRISFKDFEYMMKYDS
ncbi:EF-hand calcium-binding domain-containing protein 11-like [Tubulanus polymorphus]|uniref:EF-hand calcium-binding domain-containing protein 11-like n=1 Tax=Tubulanus polymorphus TaxID=672921 RepID=UPI003DA36F7E